MVPEAERENVNSPPHTLRGRGEPSIEPGPARTPVWLWSPASSAVAMRFARSVPRGNPLEHILVTPSPTSTRATLPAPPPIKIANRVEGVSVMIWG